MKNESETDFFNRVGSKRGNKKVSGYWKSGYKVNRIWNIRIWAVGSMSMKGVEV